MKVAVIVLSGLLTLLSTVSAAPAPSPWGIPGGDWSIDNPDTPGDDDYWITVWDKSDYNGKKLQFVTQGTHDLDFKVGSYSWKTERGKSCAVRMCARQSDGRFKSTGWWATSHRNAKVSKKNQFDRVVIGCGEKKMEELPCNEAEKPEKEKDQDRPPKPEN